MKVMDMKCCDLHTHSNYSDGTETPLQIIQQADRKGLSAVALCDHNTVAGLQEFVEAGKGSSVEAVPGIEFSTEYYGTELHLIMLFVKPQDYGAITSLLEEFRVLKQQSNLALISALNAAGFAVDYNAMLRQSHDGYINRAHIAAELTRLGYTDSIKSAFKTLLSPEAGYYVPPKRPDFFEMIRFIKKLGGISVFAHPFLSLSEGELIRILPAAAQFGLDAMETMYSRYDPGVTAMAKTLAADFNLLESGGSDFHGRNKPDIELGTGDGNLQVPIDVLSAMKRKNDKNLHEA